MKKTSKTQTTPAAFWQTTQAISWIWRKNGKGIMIRTKMSIAPCITCLMIVAACGSSGIERLRTTTIKEDTIKGGESFLVGWNMTSASGSSIDLGEVVTGDVAVISFFSTYCTRCKQKLIDHQKLYDKYAEAGLSVLGVSVDEPETQSDVRSYIRSRRLTFPVVLDTETRLLNLLNPRRTLPFSVLVDRRGAVLWTHVGYAPGDEKLFESKILDVLEKKTSPIAADPK